MKLILIAGLILFQIVSFAQTASPKGDLAVPYLKCSQQISKENIQELIFEITEDYFPELTDVHVTIKEFKAKNYFLQAKPQVTSLFNSKVKRKYFIMINSSLYKCSPSTAALKAILVHELEHIVDYENMYLGRFIKFTAKYVFGKNYRAHYEQATDMKAIQKGFALGLVEYRLWVYQQLSEQELKKKEFFYLNPEEIIYIESHRDLFFDN